VAVTGPDDSDIRATIRDLKIGAVITMVTGGFFSLATTESTDGPLRFLADLLFLRPGDGADRLTDYNHLADAIAGGVMIGWGAMIWMVADRLLAPASAATRQEIKRIILVSLGLWFVTDSAGSIAAGAWVNAVVNSSLVVVFVAAVRRI
jgi:hypothetical protein